MKGYWSGFSDAADLAAQFSEKPDDKFPMDDDVLFAVYTQQDYEGSAFVVFRKNGKLYEVNGGHCSCNGLEGQWGPQETTLDALKIRELGYGFDKDDQAAFAKIIGEATA